MVELKTSSLGGYQIIAKLGAGGMATVFLAVAVGKGRFRKLVVIKVLHDSFTNNADLLEMFLGEARLAARLSHPNVVNTFEVGEDQGHHFIAMEYLDGQPYNALIKKLGRRGIALELHLRILSELLGGLHYAHELEDFDGTPLGVVHRDVSPQNVFVCYDGQVKLLDFGVAKAACADHETRAGVIKGKLAYLAPEQITSQPVDRRADIFAVGVLLWEALAARRFATGAIEAATLHNRITGAEPRIREVVPDAPPELAELCDRAIALHPEDRYQTAQEMRDSIESYLESRRDRCRKNSLATVLADSFNEERSSMKTLVEEHVLRAYSEHPASTAEARASVPDLSAMNSVRSDLVSAPSLSGSAASAPQSSSSSLSMPQPVPPSRAPWIVAGIAVVLVAVLGAVLLTRSGNPAPVASSPAGSPIPAVSAPQPAHEEKVDTIDFVVIASPANAKISLDGAALDGNPCKARFKRDGMAHAVKVSAEGYADAERVASFDRDVTLTIALEQAGNLSAPAPRAAANPGLPAAAKDPAPASTPTEASPRTPRAGEDLRGTTPTSTRKIDEKDPYAP